MNITDQTQQVLDWLRKMRANAEAVYNPALAANCDTAIALIEKLNEKETRPQQDDETKP